MLSEDRGRLDWRGIIWFVAIAYTIAWLIDLPMYLDGKGLNSPWAGLIVLQNFTPAIATFLVIRWLSPLPAIRRATGLRRGAVGARWGRYWLFGLFGPLGFAVAAPFVAALFGLYPLDLVNFAGYREALATLPFASQLLSLGSIQVVVMIGFLFTVVYALVITPFTFGEEWGWRGYLLPSLLPLGQWPALLLSGAIWGLWHAPLIPLGFNYPQHRILGVFLMLVLGVILGTILGWLRLASGSVVPAVLGHAAIDASAGAIFVFGQAGATYDTAQVGLTGWTGWILPLLLIAFLVLTHRLPVRVPNALAPLQAVADPSLADEVLRVSSRAR
jgi:membrane protease YdiL (CAAX protease family)